MVEHIMTPTPLRLHRSHIKRSIKHGASHHVPVHNYGGKLEFDESYEVTMRKHAFNTGLNLQLQIYLSYDNGRTLCLHIRGNPKQCLYAYLKKISHAGRLSSDEIDYEIDLHNESHPDMFISRSELLRPAIFIFGLLRFRIRASHPKWSQSASLQFNATRTEAVWFQQMQSAWKRCKVLPCRFKENR